MHIQKSAYLLKNSSFQRFHLHLLLPQAGIERNSLGVSLGTNLRYLLISSVLKVVKEERILNLEMQVYYEVTNHQNEVLPIQFLLSVHFKCLISLLLLFDPHQVVLCTLLQHVLVLNSYVEDSINIMCRESWSSHKPKRYWPSWNPPGLPSCSHTSWKGQQTSVQQSWGLQWPDPSLRLTVWPTCCRTGFSAAARPLQDAMVKKQEYFVVCILNVC